MSFLRIAAWGTASMSLACLAAAAPPPARVTGYEVEAEILPASGRLVVAVRLTLVRDAYLEPGLVFGLHDRFEISKLEVDGTELPFSSRPLSGDELRPASREIVVALPAELRRPELTLEVAYGGPLAVLPQFGSPDAAASGRALDDTVSADRVELSYYSSWYPQLGEYGALFGADVAVTVPAGWTLVCTGEQQGSEELEGRRRSRWLDGATTDLVVIASPDFKVVPIRRGDGTVEIYHTSLPGAFVGREADNIRRTLALFADLLGEPAGRLATVRVVYSPRAYGQGGYSRAPMVVLSEGRVIAALHEDARLSLLRGTAHEAAHFWWRFGSGQGDWINEAFAEYFALLAVERIDAPDQYRRALARAAAVVRTLPDDAPSLAEVPASNQDHGMVIRYQKGALLLAWMRSRLGDDRFLAGCRKFYEARNGRATSTDDFRGFWSARLGPDLAPSLDAWLSSRGGAPGPS